MRNIILVVIFCGLGYFLYVSEQMQQNKTLKEYQCDKRYTRVISKEFTTSEKEVTPNLDLNSGILDISGMQLERLPYNYLKNTRCFSEFNLSNNNLNSLPSSLEKMKSLKKLDLTGNRISRSNYLVFPKELRELILSENQLDNFYIPNFNAMNKLDLAKNKIGFVKLKDDRSVIQEIILHSNEIRYFPDALSNVTHLKKLDLSDNLIKAIPEYYIQFDYLEQLNFSGNSLRKLPKDFMSYPKLKKLNVSNNKLVGPVRINYVHELVDLDLSNQKIAQVVIERGTGRNLKRVNLAHNDLFSFFCREANYSIEYLDLSHNQFKKMPKMVSKLYQLKVLDLSNNQLEELNKFPEQPLLETFILNENPNLKDISLSDIEQLSNLKVLKMKNTGISKSELNKIISYCEEKGIDLTYK